MSPKPPLRRRQAHSSGAALLSWQECTTSCRNAENQPLNSTMIRRHPKARHIRHFLGISGPQPLGTWTIPGRSSRYAIIPITKCGVLRSAATTPPLHTPVSKHSSCCIHVEIAAMLFWTLRVSRAARDHPCRETRNRHPVASRRMAPTMAVAIASASGPPTHRPGSPPPHPQHVA
jgi:hypothetical protein